MTAPTTTTLTTVKRQLVTLFDTALATSGWDGGQVPVDYAWPGPSTSHEAVFLGFHPELRDLTVDAQSDIPTIKSGRQQTAETYTVPVTAWTFRPDLHVSDARDCEIRAEVLYSACASALADDPKIGLAADVIRWAKAGAWESTLWPFQTGWACSWVFFVDVQARLL